LPDACRSAGHCRYPGNLPRANLQAAATSGFSNLRPAKRPKSRSAVHSSLTPCCRQSAAIRASWTRGPDARLGANVSRSATNTRSPRPAAPWSAPPARGDLLEGVGLRGGRIVDPRMCHDGQELVNARPGDRPRCGRFGRSCEVPIGRLVPGRVLAMRVHQDVGIDGDQPPAPSYARSRIAARSLSLKPGCRPRPRKLCRRRRGRSPRPTGRCLEIAAQGGLDSRPQRGVALRGAALGLPKEGIADLDGGLHMGTRIGRPAYMGIGVPKPAMRRRGRRLGRTGDAVRHQRLCASTSVLTGARSFLAERQAPHGTARGCGSLPAAACGGSRRFDQGSFVDPAAAQLSRMVFRPCSYTSSREAKKLRHTLVAAASAGRAVPNASIVSQPS
jgi:hypothetical protein